MALGEEVAALGRGGDTDLGHLEPGDLVVPKKLIDAEPGVLQSFIKAMTKVGADWRSFQVGAPEAKINPNTGLEEFQFAGVTGGAIGGTLGDVARGLDPQRGGAVEEERVAPLSTPALQEQRFQRMEATPFGEGVAPSGVRPLVLGVEPPREAPEGLAPVRGTIAARRGPPGFIRPPAQQIPGALQGQLSRAMSPLQLRTAIATRGVAGADPRFRGQEAREFFTNELRRSLIGEGGELSPFTEVTPVEQQFLRQVFGLGFEPTTQSLLQALTAF